MLQKLLVGLLGFTVLGATGVGIYDSAQTNTENAQVAVLADSAQINPINAPQTAPLIAPTVTPAANPVPGVQDGTGPIQQQALQQQQALDMVGDPWSAVGTIIAFDINGMTLALADGSSTVIFEIPAGVHDSRTCCPFCGYQDRWYSSSRTQRQRLCRAV